MNSKKKNQFYLKEAEWQLVANLAILPSKGRRKSVDPRTALSACLCVLDSGMTWKAASEMFGISSTTIRSYYKKLRQNRKWNQIHSIIEIYRETKGRVAYRIVKAFTRVTAIALVLFMFALPAYPVFAQEAKGEVEAAPIDEKTEQPADENNDSQVVLLAEQKNITANETAEQEIDTTAAEGSDEEMTDKENKPAEAEDGPADNDEKKVSGSAEDKSEIPVNREKGVVFSGEGSSADDAKNEIENSDNKTESLTEDSQPKTISQGKKDTAGQPDNENKTAAVGEVNRPNETTKTTQESQPTEKPKTVFAIKEISKKAEPQEQSVNETDEEIDDSVISSGDEIESQDDGVVAGVNTQAKNVDSTQHAKESTANTDINRADDSDSSTESLEHQKNTKAPKKADSQNVQQDEPVDIEALREELRREVMAEVMKGCLEFEDGSYYCADEAVKGGEEDHMERWLNLFSSKRESDLEYDEEIYFEKDGKQVRLTGRKTRDMFLAQDVAGRSAVWQSLVNGRWQVFYYDKDSEEPKQLTSGNYNNMHPQIYDNTVVWQAWVDGDWDIFMAEKQMVKLPNSAGQAEDGAEALSEGWVLRQITDNDLPDMFPRIAAGVITWQGYRAGAWQVFAFDLKSRTVAQISDGQGNYENPRFTIVWDDRQESGETFTVGYDIASGELQKLGEFGDQDDEPITNDTAQHDEDIIMVSRSEGTQNQQNKDKNENKKTQN